MAGFRRSFAPTTEGRHQTVVHYITHPKNRTLNEMVRCMLLDAGLLTKYFAEASISHDTTGCHTKRSVVGEKRRIVDSEAKVNEVVSRCAEYDFRRLFQQMTRRRSCLRRIDDRTTYFGDRDRNDSSMDSHEDTTLTEADKRPLNAPRGTLSTSTPISVSSRAYQEVSLFRFRAVGKA